MILQAFRNITKETFKNCITENAYTIEKYTNIYTLLMIIILVPNIINSNIIFFLKMSSEKFEDYTKCSLYC